MTLYNQHQPPTPPPSGWNFPVEIDLEFALPGLYTVSMIVISAMYWITMVLIVIATIGFGWAFITSPDRRQIPDQWFWIGLMIVLLALGFFWIYLQSG